MNEDHALHFTIFRSLNTVRANTVPKASSWRTFVREIKRAPEYASKRECPLIKLATFGNNLTADGQVRHDENVLQVYGLEGDHDSGTVSIDDAVARLSAVGVNALVVSTASYSHEAPRWRIFVPLSAPCAPRKRTNYVALLNGILGGALAPESFVLSQSFFFGRVATVPYICHEVQGKPIDAVWLEDVTPTFPPGRRHSDPQLIHHESGVIDFDRDIALRKVDDQIMNDLRGALAAVPADDRDIWMQITHALGSLKETQYREDAREIWLNWSATSASHNPTEDTKKWDERIGIRTSYLSVFKIAADHGWVNPWKGRSTGNDATRADSAQGETLPTLRMLSVRDIKSLPPGEFTIEGVVPRRGLGALIGPTSIGKTYFAIDLGLTIALGRTWHGYTAGTGSVVHVAGEGAQGFRARILAYEAHNQLVLDGVPFHLVPEPIDLLSGRDAQRVVDACRNLDPPVRLVVIDTLNRATPGGDENSSVDMGKAIASATYIAEQVDAFVMLVHHTGKNPSLGARGHSSLVAAVDTELEIKASGDLKILKVNKQRDGEAGAEYGFRLESVSFVDADGNATDSGAVVVPVMITGPRAPQSMWRRTVLEVFEDAGENPFDQGMPLDELVDRGRAAHRKLHGKEPSRRFREQFMRELKSLVSSGLVQELDGRYMHFV